jgi:SAM-dependent methyltransferase
MALGREGDRLTCRSGHGFAIVQGIPVLLSEGIDPTHPYLSASLDRVRRGGFSPAEVSPSHGAPSEGAIDPFVQDEIVKTNGNLYRHLRGRLTRYPIPELRLPAGEGKLLLDVGCNWGRWTLSAAQTGYRAVGVDPGLDAALAAQRVARQLGLDVAFVVGDARRLPFTDGTFDVSFSYSVFQHFDKGDAQRAIQEMSRVTALGGKVLVQMANLLGLRQAYNRLRQLASRDANPFRVRYWRPRELRDTFERIVGPSRLDVDGFFSLNPQSRDLDLLSAFQGWVVRSSDALRGATQIVPALKLVADSLYVESLNHRSYQPADRPSAVGAAAAPKG